ncbi:hypothetical protein AQUCO_02600156v1 [Aquilegia coerulea]|uniref:Uncharacterized protein n=1 Tax=Aquilegia coerulea TaxID=218851 RepID=A0A2G5D7M0_AQUCA|nr:hypothetical protein AQUCO_02600156v1 [Aquilegia coerulea]
MAIPPPPPNRKPASKFNSEEEEFESDEEDDQKDSLWNQDMEAVRRACMLTGTNPNEIEEDFNTTISISDSESSEVDDIELVRRIQQSINSNSNKPVSLKPLKSLPPVGLSDISSDDDDDEDDDDLQTLRAIQRRFANYVPNAIKKNRSFQKLVMRNLIHIEAKIEENKKLKERIKILRDFQVSCKRRAGRALSQKKDPRIQLISACKPRKSSVSKVNDKKVPALYLGPVENSHVDNYRMVMQRFPRSLRRECWSDVERENLGKGIKQQFQEMLLQKSLERYSDQMVSSGDSNTFDDIMTSIRDFDIPPESIRTFLPKVDWERLASLYAVGRSGAECEARWLNHEDPLINHNPWTKVEDKNLLFIVRQRGIYNWIDISKRMKTSRTPFQCFVRYQRSLNAHIMKRDWLEEDDAQLRSAVEAFGENNWQLVASYVEGRTGTQCSNRWMKTLNPARERVGRWTIEEDKHLKVAVVLFGSKTWNKISQFVPGRTQAQCRERWVNVLDPSLNLARWTADEDFKLKAAIAEHGHCWRKVAEAVPPRTDNQCRRRWKVLFPHEVPILQAARRVEKIALISNFVEREAERPELGSSDFLPLPGPNDITEDGNNIRKGKEKSRRTARSMKQKDMSPGNDDFSKKKKVRKQRLKSSRCPEPPLSSEEILPSDQILSKENVGDGDEKTVPKENVAGKKKKGLKPCSKEKCTKSKHCGQELPLSIETSGGLKNESITEDNTTSKKKRKGRPCSDNKKCKEREPCDHQEPPLSPQLSAILEIIGGEHEILTEDNTTLQNDKRKVRAKRNKYSQQEESNKSKVAGISQSKKSLEIMDEDDELEDNESLASFLHNKMNKVKRKAHISADKNGLVIIPPARKRKVTTEIPSVSETSMLLAETVDGDDEILTSLMKNKVKRRRLKPAGKEKIPKAMNWDDTTLAFFLNKKLKRRSNCSSVDGQAIAL